MNPAPDTITRKDRAILLAAGGLALLPFLAWHRQFAEIFWFGDEWDMIDQIDRIGLGRWIWLTFAENLVPVAKLSWGGALWLSGGHYFFMLLCVWLTHALNTVLLGRLLRRTGFGWFPTLLTLVVFALTSINIEALGWSAVWSAVQATTFLLLGLDTFLQWTPPAARPTRGAIGRLVAYSAASAFCFSRGVLTGAVLALGCLWPATGGAGATSWRQRAGLAALCLLPALVAVGLIIGFASGNHQHLGGHLWSAILYGLWHFSLNPLHLLLEVDSWGPRTTTLLGLGKLALVTWALLRHPGRIRLLLGLLLAFDLSNSLLVGIGRYHTGLETVISSRYQYCSLVTTLPFLALGLAALGGRWPTRSRRYAAGVTLVVIAFLAARHWPDEAGAYAASRGTETRRLLFLDPAPPAEGAIPGVATMPTARAKELIRRYNLH